MNRNCLLAVVTVAGLFAGAPNMVLAEQEQRDPIAMYVDAGASPEQQGKIRALATEFEKSAKVKIERAQNLLKKLQQFSLEPLPDEKTVLATQGELNALQSDIAMSRIRLMLQIRGVLTEEQRVKLVQLLKESRPQQGM
jgi:Spy/CpxP family protein refolding chaperone